MIGNDVKHKSTIIQSCNACIRLCFAETEVHATTPLPLDDTRDATCKPSRFWVNPKLDTMLHATHIIVVVLLFDAAVDRQAWREP